MPCCSKQGETGQTRGWASVKSGALAERNFNNLSEKITKTHPDFYVLPDSPTDAKTHFGHRLVGEETCSQASHQASHLQGTDVGTPCNDKHENLTKNNSGFLSWHETKANSAKVLPAPVPVSVEWPLSWMRKSWPQSVHAVFTPNTTR